MHAPLTNDAARIHGLERINWLAYAIREAHWQNLYTEGTVGPRAWHLREQERSPMHPAVLAACEMANPADWHELVLQWPHKSAKEAGRLAYTQDEKKGEADRQTVTTIGKYLTRHFQGLPDHVIRGLAHRFSVEGVFIWETTEEIVRAAKEGPYSCMQWAGHEGTHPYEVYAPEHGWKIAVRIDGGVIKGRALLLDNGKHKCFVRTYLRPSDSAKYSERDEAMEAHLGGLGFSCKDAWPEGAKLAKVRSGSGYQSEYLFPYLDGNCQTVDDEGDYFVIRRDGEYECDNTDGSATGAERYTCSCCGDPHADEDDGIHTGRYGDEWVGPCCSDDYVRVTGRRGDGYYLHADNATEVDGEYYDNDYLSDNGIVELHNGDFAKEDDCFHCPIREEHYLHEDGTVTEDEGYVHQDEAWTCAVSGGVYSTNTDSVENAAGEMVHPDHLEEEESAD